MKGNRSFLLTTLIIFFLISISITGCEDDSATMPDPPEQNPPIAPSNLEGEALSPDEIRLTWNDRSENEQGFEIHQSIGDQSNFELSEETEADIISFTLTERAPSTTYYFKVRGFNQGGMGEFSNVVSVSTPSGPPESPSNLVAEAVSASQINLSWNDNSECEEGFILERKTAEAEIWIEIGQTEADISSYQDTGLEAATAYDYRVKAYNESGESEYSNETSAMTDEAPEDVPNAPSDLNVEAVSSSQINLSWVDNSDNEEGFDIERRPEAGGSWDVVQQVGADVTTVYDQELEPSTTYYYRVKAYNAAGNSDYSNVASASTQEPPNAVPEAPSGLQVEAVSLSQINLSWQDNSDNEDGFKIEQRIGEGGSWGEIDQTGPGANNYQNRGLAPNTTYYYRVRAFNSIGDSPYSNVASTTTLHGPPLAPTNLQAIAISATEIELSWNDNSDNEDGYKIERKTGNEGAWSEIEQVGTNVGNWVNRNLEPETTYFYRVRAYNERGDSDFSNESSATTHGEGLPAPELIDPPNDNIIGREEIRFSWTSVNDAYQYKLQMSGSDDFINSYVNLASMQTSINYDFSQWQYDETFYWRVGVRKDGEDWNDAVYSDCRVLHFNPGDEFPAPELLSPDNGIRFGAVDMEFDWTDVAGAVEYRFLVSEAIDFNATPISHTRAVSNTLVHFNNLDWLSEGTYFWCAEARADGMDWEEASRSEPRTFIFDRSGGPEPGEEREFPLNEDVNIVMCWIPPGDFMMGARDDEQHSVDDELPMHRVEISYGFWMSKFEITQGQWEAVMHNNPANGYGEGENFPVYNVSWDLVQDFEANLDDIYRLPSEAEWEYACRAGSDTRYYFGNDPGYEDIVNFVWFARNADNHSHEVGTRQPNAWGLHDMSGNLWELCEDWYHGNYDGAPGNGNAWISPSGDVRVTRGGSFDNEEMPSYCRSAKRGMAEPGPGFHNVGFRLVRTSD